MPSDAFPLMPSWLKCMFAPLAAGALASGGLGEALAVGVLAGPVEALVSGELEG